MVWNPANDFMAGYQFGEGVKGRRLEQERETRYRDALPGVIKNAYGLDISGEEVDEAFQGEAPDMEEMAAASIEEEFGEDAEFLGFESSEDGRVSRARFRRSPDGEAETYKLDDEDLLVPNDPGVGVPDTEALKAIFDYNPEVGMQLLESVKTRRERQRQRALQQRRRGLQASVLEQQAGVGQQPDVTVDDLVDTPSRVATDRGSVGQNGAPSLEAAQNMPRNRQSGAQASPAAPMPETPEGLPLQSPASRAPATLPPSARRNSTPAMNGELDENQAAFVQSIWSDAERTARELGVPTEAVVAQAALESGWGQSAPGNNVFGIKGEGQRLPTEEVVDGERRGTAADFRTYDSQSGSFRDLRSVLSDERYADARGAQTPGEYGAALQAGGYATDPEYGAKIEAVANTIRSGMSLPENTRRSPSETLARARRDLANATPEQVGRVAGDAVRSTGETLAGWAGDTASLWNQYGQPAVDNSVAAYQGLGRGLVSGVTGREPEPTESNSRESQLEQQQPEQPRDSRRQNPRQAQTESGRFTFNANAGRSGDGQSSDAQGDTGRVNLELPTQRQVDRARAQAQQQIRAGNSSNELAGDIIDGVRSGALSFEQGQGMLGLGDKEYYKPQELEDGSVIAVSTTDPTDVVEIRPGGEKGQLSDKDRFKQERQVVNDFNDDMYPDSPQRAALAATRAFSAQSANVLDLSQQSARGVMYNAERFTNAMGKDAGWLWFDKNTNNITSYTPAILAMSAGYEPENARQAAEEMLQPIRAAAGRRLNQNELRMLGNAVAKSVAANPRNADPQRAVAELTRLMDEEGVDSVIAQLRENNVRSN